MTLQFAATSVWQNGADKMPSANTQIPPAWDFSVARRPDGLVVDNCFAGWHRSAVFDWPEHGATLTMSADQNFRHLVVFFPEGADFCAVEPVANMNDGINRMGQHVDHGMTVLAPGETLSGVVTFTVARR
jgi:aldose 1-epimerase